MKGGAKNMAKKKAKKIVAKKKATKKRKKQFIKFCFINKKIATV